MKISIDPRFPLGRVTITRDAMALIPLPQIIGALHRHRRGDWGDLCPHDVEENERALTENLRLLSVYLSTSKVRFWINTEADRSATTVMLPEDY